MKTTEFDYTFAFVPIQNKSTQVTLLTHREDKRDYFTISIDDSALSINGLPTVPSICADLLDLAIAIHVADRLIRRQKDVSLSFQVVLPVRNYDVFVRSNVCNLLSEVLDWYTNDLWHFEFSKREALGRNVEVQSQLPWENLSSKNVEVALWSGGLDSLSGLYTRLLTNLEPHHFLVGTGSNSNVHKRQKQIADVISQSFSSRITLVQIPYHWHNTPLPEKNFHQRTRGLVFMLIGAACAYHIGSNSLFIYENGIGAINLPYSKAQVGIDQAKSVHPLSLLRVSELLSSILDSPFQVTNPFWLWTKAQMVESLISNEGKKLIPLSSSCDRIHRLEDGITQCGVCTSCLLRRQSLCASGIDDQTIYDNKFKDKNDSHLTAMLHQVNRIRMLLKETNPWVSLSKEYYDLDDIVDQISSKTNQEPSYLRMQIIQLYSKYVDEWNLFEKFIEKTLQPA